MIIKILNYVKNIQNKNKLQMKSLVSNVKFFFIRDFMFVIKESYIGIIVFNLIIHVCLGYFQSIFSTIYRVSILFFILSVMILYVVLFSKSSKTNEFTELQKSKINSEALAQTWSKWNQVVVKILLMLVSYFIQLYFQLNFKLFNIEPALAMASHEMMQGCFMFLLAAMMTYFAYQSQLFKIAYENKMF